MACQRTCGTCQMCCRVFPIPEVSKPHTDWCSHLEPGKGCRIYEQRPAPCRDFECGWLRDENLDDAWRPDRAGFVLSDPEPWALLATCDPEKPDAWRRAPYHEVFLSWADGATRRGLLAGVRENDRLFIVTGEKTIEIPDENCQ